MRGMHQILVLPQLKIPNFTLLQLLLFNQSLLGLHCSHPTYLLVCFHPRLLETFNGFFELSPDPGVVPSQLDYSTQPFLCLDPELGQFVVEVVEFRVIGNVSMRNLHLGIIVLVF